MWLTYAEYLSMGGLLDEPTFSIYNKKAQVFIRAQAAGRAGLRIDELDEIPQAIIDCVFDLIQFFSTNTASSAISSYSQSSGGVSESTTYREAEPSMQEAENIVIYNFFGAGIGHLLYKGLII